MFSLLKSLLFAACMVPVVMALILGAIYGLGEVFNMISKIKFGRSDHRHSEYKN
ncbi:AcrZ family multidrug efflux pump-associated protein [Pragia fontium]|uniref:AcrZ family multidrug efflux pump-associated protein n=1 Tax=Pragia fontium TaxID=82985 RepID=UPI0006496F31|nr:AcrZ family multidrug efflux pump-associated protein [Pragia fontium]AKJ43797.1 membrane protein [Pragia fontium]